MLSKSTKENYEFKGKRVKIFETVERFIYVQRSMVKSDYKIDVRCYPYFLSFPFWY